MFYQKVSPVPHLRPFVECFFVWENTVPLAQPLRIESPPSGFASMVFTYGNPYRVRTEKQTTQVPGAFLTGQATHQYELELTGRIGMIGIVFRPAGLSSLFGLPMYEFTDERTALADVFGNSITNLHEQINLSRTSAERIALLEQFLSRQFLRQANPFDRTDYAANLIVEQRGVLPISKLMDDLYVCRRQFERQFLHKVGISPKYYARIRRVGYLCAQLATQRWQVRDWQDMIFRAGYYDQSHFIREFSQMTGKRPTLYLKDNVELTRFLD